MRLHALVLIFPLCLAASPAPAQAPAQARAAAEALFREGVALAKNGKLKEACPKFEESQRLDPQTGTLIYLATCHAEQGKTATAWVEFNRAQTLAARAGQTERAETARARATELEPKLSRVTIEVPASVAGIQVTLDGNVLEAPSLDTGLPVDPGEHEISASAPGYESWSKRINVSSGPSALTVTIPALTRLDGGEPEAKPLPAARPVDSRPPPGASRGGVSRTLGWVGIGVGAVGIGVGSYFGLRAIGTKNDADEYCQGRFCEPTGLEKHDDAKQQATISTVAFGVGLAATTVGVVLLVTSGSGKERGAVVLQTRAHHAGGTLSIGRTW